MLKIKIKEKYKMGAEQTRTQWKIVFVDRTETSLKKFY